MEKTYKLIGIGNFTLTLRGTYNKIIRDDFGRPIGNETIQPLQLIFNNGVPVEVNEETLSLVQKTRAWGNSISFHPASLPKDAEPEVKKVAEITAKAVERKLEEKRGKRERAREGSVNPETNDSFES